MSKSFSKIVLAGLVFVGFNAHASDLAVTSASNNETQLSFMDDSELSQVQGAKKVTFADSRWTHHNTSRVNAAQYRTSGVSKAKFSWGIFGLFGMAIGEAFYLRDQHKTLTKFYSDPKTVTNKCNSKGCN